MTVSHVVETSERSPISLAPSASSGWMRSLVLFQACTVEPWLKHRWAMASPRSPVPRTATDFMVQAKGKVLCDERNGAGSADLEKLVVLKAQAPAGMLFDVVDR